MGNGKPGETNTYITNTQAGESGGDLMSPGFALLRLISRAPSLCHHAFLMVATCRDKHHRCLLKHSNMSVMTLGA
eukprot:36804-Eustigmatos_ZCMA.PRE.1